MIIKKIASSIVLVMKMIVTCIESVNERLDPRFMEAKKV